MNEESGEMNQDEKREMPPGLALRVTVSIVVLFGGLIFAIIYVAFFASSFSLFQKIAVILVALLAVIAILGVMWASWGIKLGKEWKEKGHE
jgi:hypothetical protein